MINRLICAPEQVLRNTALNGAMGISLYSCMGASGFGSVGTTVRKTVSHLGMSPSNRSWDFLSLALSVVTADNGFARTTSPDGWTREINIKVSVTEPSVWNREAALIEKILCFLTGDIWKVSFLPGGIIPKGARKLNTIDASAVTLLSGGLDSLIGAIDLTAVGEKLMAVSQVSSGDKDHQIAFAKGIGGGLLHFQANHNAHPIESLERTQRSRSFVFFAFAILCATSLARYKKGKPVKVYVPENGFISLNIPLTPLRIGSFSTRTTHPRYMNLLQTLFNNLELGICLANPYQLKTKGEMIKECKDQTLLRKYAWDSTSCGRFARYGYTHCGKCVPCLVRRAAFHHARKKNKTTYVYTDLSLANGDPAKFEDICSACLAIEKVEHNGLDAWIGSALNTAQLGNISAYKDVANRGLNEIKRFLSFEAVL